MSTFEMKKQQAQGDGVLVFWNNVKLEVDTMKLKQAEVQFAVNQSLMGNKANSILNKMKLSFILNQKNNAPYARLPESKLRSKKNHSRSILPNGIVLPTPPQSNFTPPSGSDKVRVPSQIGSILSDGIALPTPPQSNFTPPSNSDKVRVPSQIGSILPDGTVLPKPPLQPNFIPARDSDEVSFSSSQMTFDDDDDGEETSDLDSFLPTNTQKWNLPSGNSIKEIYSVNISQCAEVLKKKKTLNPVERSTLRYGMSKIIDLLTYIRNWFSNIDIQHMMKDHVAVLTVPALDEEVNVFIVDVEKMVQKEGSNEAYKYCLEKHTNSPNNTCIYKISKIYSEFFFKVKDGDDLLDCGEGYTEIDIIVKTCSYIVKGLRKGLRINCKCRSTSYEKRWKCDVRFLSSSRTDLGEWEFSAHCTNAKVIGDCCRSAKAGHKMGLLDQSTCADYES
ncbi:hypothetical protein RhiirA4_472384 [Rhizophagus irregularis]|uniref:Uncharacterized protein n=1 Tax=Rhizophagus irregularis TaxID=588596 RepID=A0A2I1H4X4_9GLOM|nr:hypothetical protein RhiirA4_472384 [Rhizophagus irregularis]